MRASIGARGSTTYVASSDVAHVGSCVLELLAREGFVPVPPPPPRQASAFDLAQDADPRAWLTWQLEVAAGVRGWSAIRTWPLEALAGASPGALRPRAAELAVLAGAAVKSFTYFGPARTYAVEASGDGDFSLTPSFREMPRSSADVARALATQLAGDGTLAESPMLSSEIPRGSHPGRMRQIFWVRRPPALASPSLRTRGSSNTATRCALCAIDPDVRAQLRRALERRRFRYFVASSATSAWSLASAAETGVVIVGSLRRLDALRLVDRLRSERAENGPSVLACAFDDGSDHAASFRAPRVDAYLPVPLDAEALTHTLCRVAALARLRRAAAPA